MAGNLKRGASLIAEKLLRGVIEIGAGKNNRDKSAITKVM